MIRQRNLCSSKPCLGALNLLVCTISVTRTVPAND